MGWQIIKQPDSKFGVFSSVVDDWVATDCTADEVEELFGEEMGRDVARRLRDVRKKIALVDAGEARKAYYQFAMTFEEADALAKHGPECEDDPEPVTDVPMVCTSCRKPVERDDKWDGWQHVFNEDGLDCSAVNWGPVRAMVAAGQENVR